MMQSVGEILVVGCALGYWSVMQLRDNVIVNMSMTSQREGAGE